MTGGGVGLERGIHRRRSDRRATFPGFGAVRKGRRGPPATAASKPLLVAAFAVLASVAETTMPLPVSSRSSSSVPTAFSFVASRRSASLSLARTEGRRRFVGDIGEGTTSGGGGLDGAARGRGTRRVGSRSRGSAGGSISDRAVGPPPPRGGGRRSWPPRRAAAFGATVAGAATTEAPKEEPPSSVEEGEGVVAAPRRFVPYPFEYREELTLRVASLTNLGVGICRVPLPDLADDEEEKARRRPASKSDGAGSDESAASIVVVDADDDGEGAANGTKEKKSGWVIMVPNVIPGELVRVRVYRNYKSYSDADLLDVVEPSPNRIEPKCNLSAVCGGCQYQHVDVETQRQWKTRQVQDLLERIGKFERGSFPNVLPTAGTEEVYGYRSKITPHYDAPSKNKKVDGCTTMGPIGFKEKTSRRLVDVPRCEIATEAINERLSSLREEKIAAAGDGTLKKPKKGATLLLREANEGVVTDNNRYVTADVNDLTFRFRAGNFFQNNPYVLPLMVDGVVSAAARPPAWAENEDEEAKMTHVVDCYCGSGLFCLSASKDFEVCVGIEVNELAVSEARENARSNGIRNCAFVAASAEAIFDGDDPVAAVPPAGKRGASSSGGAATMRVRDFPRGNTAVVLDPPRKGCSEEFLTQLCAFRPQRVVYMSCDPATQARDAKALVEDGYDIISTQPFDLFPQTRHIECLVVFERRAGKGKIP